MSESSLRVEVVDDDAAFAALGGEWDALLSESSGANAFLTWEWLHSWWRHLRGSRRLNVVAVRRGRELVALAPLAQRPGVMRFLPPRLEWLGTGTVGSDYLDLIVRDGEESAAVEALADHLSKPHVALDLRQLPASGSRAEALAGTLALRGWRVSRRNGDVCPLVQLEGHTWESFLRTLGPEHRANVRRRLRKLEQLGDVSLEEVRSEERRPDVLAALLRLHQRRWTPRGGSDAFDSSGVVAFHEEATRRLLERGWLRLYALRVGGEAVAALYGLRYGSSFFFYQSGFDTRYDRWSVGLVLLARVIERAIEEGAREFDLLHGDESYKFLWARHARALSRIEIDPPGAAAAAHRVAVDGARAARHAVRRLLPSGVASLLSTRPAPDRLATFSLRRLAKTAVASGLEWTRANDWVGAATGARALPLIVGYHRVEERAPGPSTAGLPGMVISRAMLEKQLDWIGRRYRFVSLDELEAKLEAREPSPQPVAAVTFDDGYSDVYLNAVPLLKAKGIPAAVFVVTDLVGTNRLAVYDRLYLLLEGVYSRGEAARESLALILKGLDRRLPERGTRAALARDAFSVLTFLLGRLSQEGLERIIAALEAAGDGRTESPPELRPLSWEMLAAMRDAGFTIGSHTRTHPLLCHENPERVRDEVVGSRAALEARLGIDVRHFAYPDGRWTDDVLAAVATAGYRCGYAVCGHRDSSRPLLTIPRRMLWEGSCLDAFGRFSGAVMSGQANGVYDFIVPCHRRHHDWAPPLASAVAAGI